MPNEIFHDTKDWLEEGSIKSVQHQEFIYSYYWLLAYLWRLALYSQQNISQPDIKQMLGYNSNDKRLDYIMKKNGLLDTKEYTSTTKNYPVSWSKKGSDDLQFTMLHEFDEGSRIYLKKFASNNSFVKEPLKHTGDSENEGIYWNSSNTHLMSGEVLELCLSNSKLGCAGFYLYGILTFIQDKSGGGIFPCSNETLITYTNWNVRRVIRVTGELQRARLLQKEQPRKSKGSVNHYQLT